MLALVICGALIEPENKQAALDAEKAALALAKDKLSERELGMIASALHRLKRTETAEVLDKKIMEMIKKKQAARRTSSPRPGSRPVYYNQWQKTQQLLRDGKFKEALPLVKKEYYSRFMKSLQQQRQYGNYNFSYAGSIINSVKRYGKDKELLELLRPKDKEPPVVSLLMYAYACESLKKNNEAYKAYLNAFKRYPDKKEVISILLPFVVKNKDTDIKAFVNMIPAHRLRFVLDSVSRNQYQYNGNYDRMLDLFEGVMAKQRTSVDKDLLQFDQNSFYLLCNMFINIGFPELRQRYSYNRNSSNKQKDKENQEQARKLLGEICDHVIKTRPPLIQSAMEFKLLLAGDDKEANDKLYLEAMALLKNKKMLMAVNPYSGVYNHHSMYGGQNGNKPLLEFMVSYAIRHKRVPELVKAIGDDSITKGIDQVAELYKCPPKKFPEALKKFLEEQKVFNLSTAVIMGIDAAEAVIKKAPDNINSLVLSKVSFGPVYANQNFPQNYIDILLEKKQDKVAMDFLEQFAKKLNSPELTGQYANQAQYQYNAAIQKILNKNPEKAFEIWKLEKSFKKPSNQQTSRYHSMRNSLNQMANNEKKPRWNLFGKTPQEFKYYPAAGGCSLFTTYVQYLRGYRNKFPAYTGSDFCGKMLNLAIAAKRGSDIYTEFAKLNDQLKTLPEQDRTRIYSGLPRLISELNLQAAGKLTGVAEDIRRRATRATSVSATQKAQEFIKTARGANVQGYQYSRDAISLIEGLAGNSELIDKVVEHTIKELKINRNYHYQRNNYEITNFLRQLAQKGERSLPTLGIAWRCMLKYPDYIDNGMYSYIPRGVEQACYRAKRKNDAQGLINLFDELPKVFGDNPPFLFPVLDSQLRSQNKDQINALFRHVNSKKYPANATAKECVLISKYLKAKKSKPIYQKQICDLYEQFLKTDEKIPDKIKQQMLFYSFQRNHLKNLAPFMVDYALKDLVRSGNLYDNHQYYTIAKAMAECPDSEQWRKSAKTLQESFSVSGGNPSNHTYRRLFAAMLEIAIRLKDKKQVETLVKASLRFKQSMQGVCITLLNNGYDKDAMALLQTEIAKPSAANYSNTRLSDAGWEHAKKLLSQVKDPENQLLFSAVLLPLAPNRSNVRSDVENEYIKLMETYQKHKFSSPQVRKNFLMRLFRANSSRLELVKRDFRKILRELPLKEAMSKEYDPFRHEIARALVDYFIMKDYKAYKAKLDELAAFAENMPESSNQGRQCRTILSSMPGVINNYAYSLKNQGRLLTSEQIKLWADTLTIFMQYNPNSFYSGEYIGHILWLNHLAGNDKASLKIISLRKHQLVQVNPSRVLNKLRSLSFIADSTGKSRDQQLKLLFKSETWQVLAGQKKELFDREQKKLLESREVKNPGSRIYDKQYQQRSQLQEMFMTGQDKKALAEARNLYISLFQKVLIKLPRRTNELSSLNNVLQSVQKYGQGNEFLKLLQAGGVTSTNELLTYGYACGVLGSLEEAFKSYDKVMAEHSDNKEFLTLIGISCLQRSGGDVKKIFAAIPGKYLPYVFKGVMMNSGYSPNRNKLLEVMDSLISRPEWDSPDMAGKHDSQAYYLAFNYLYRKAYPELAKAVNFGACTGKTLKTPDKEGKKAEKLLIRICDLAIRNCPDIAESVIAFRVLLGGNDEALKKQLFASGLANLKKQRFNPGAASLPNQFWRLQCGGDRPFNQFMISYAVRNKRETELLAVAKPLTKIMPEVTKLYNAGNNFPQIARDFAVNHRPLTDYDATVLICDAAKYQNISSPSAIDEMVIAKALNRTLKLKVTDPGSYVDIMQRFYPVEDAVDFIKQYAGKIVEVGKANPSRHMADSNYDHAVGKLVRIYPATIKEIVGLEAMLEPWTSHQSRLSRDRLYVGRMQEMAYRAKPSEASWDFFGSTPEQFNIYIYSKNGSLFGAYVGYRRRGRRTRCNYSGTSFGGKLMDAALHASSDQNIYEEVSPFIAKMTEQNKLRLAGELKFLFVELNLPQSKSPPKFFAKYLKQDKKRKSVAALNKAEQFLAVKKDSGISYSAYIDEALNLSSNFCDRDINMAVKIVYHVFDQICAARNGRIEYVNMFFYKIHKLAEKKLALIGITWRLLLKYPQYCNPTLVNMLYRSIQRSCTEVSGKQQPQAVCDYFDMLSRGFGDAPPFLYKSLHNSLRNLQKPVLQQLYKHVSTDKFKQTLTGKECALIIESMVLPEKRTLIHEKIARMYIERLKSKLLTDALKEQLLYCVLHDFGNSLAGPAAVEAVSHKLFRTPRLRPEIIAMDLSKEYPYPSWRNAARTLLDNLDTSKDISASHSAMSYFWIYYRLALKLHEPKYVERLNNMISKSTKPVPGYCVILLENGNIKEALTRLDAIKNITDWTGPVGMTLSAKGYKNALKMLSSIDDPEHKIALITKLLLLQPLQPGKKQLIEQLLRLSDKTKFKSEKNKQAIFLMLMLCNDKLPESLTGHVRMAFAHLPVAQLASLQDYNSRSRAAFYLADFVSNASDEAVAAKLKDISDYLASDQVDRKLRLGITSILSQVTRRMSRYFARSNGDALIRRRVKNWGGLLTILSGYRRDTRYYIYMLWFNYLSGQDEKGLIALKNYNSSYRFHNFISYLQSYLWLPEAYNKNRLKTIKAFFESPAWRQISQKNPGKFDALRKNIISYAK